MKKHQTPFGVPKANFTRAICAGLLLMLAGGMRANAESDPALASFSAGNQSIWHGNDRYDFIMDDATLAVTPYQAPRSEGDGVSDPAAGQRRCIIVVPPAAAAGRPWSWRGCYWNHQPQVEMELLKRGFCIAYISASSTLRPGKEWDAWYSFLVEKHGMSPKPSFVGMSRGGEFAYQWATHHPDEVSCIYADNPGGNWDVFMHLAALATNDVPVLHVCGSIDPILGRFTLPMEDMYRDFGGRISVLIKEGAGHHPHSLKDVTPIVDFMVHTRNETPVAPPDFVGAQFTKSHYYSSASIYQFSPAEQRYVTLRGPVFAPCYDRYQFEQPNVEAFTTVIVPQTPAPGKPWVFRADFVGRDNAVDLELLARGFHIVTGAVPYNAEGPVLSQWNTLYSNLVAHGFSSKPVMEGVGGAAGEAYAWAIANPDKVAGICVVNPALHSNLAKTQPLDNLEPLARAKVPILHVVDPADPGFEANTGPARKKYQQLGGRLDVITVAGQAQRPLVVKDLKPVVDFIADATH
jgi:pimeloyl-ACP methyl ester carboxylesterase